MSLFDIDKHNDNRREPRPNQNDQQTQRMAHNTYGNTNRQDGDSAVQRMRFMNGLIVTYDSENRISSAYGYIPEVSAVPVFIVANEGYDVFVDILGISQPTV